MYLSMLIDFKMSFSKHVARIPAEDSYTVSSIIWSESLGRFYDSEKPHQNWRSTNDEVFIVRVTSTYSTVSEPDSVIVGITPIDFSQANAKSFIIECRGWMIMLHALTQKHKRSRASRQFGSRIRLRWARRIIKQVKPWVQRKPGEIDCYLIKFPAGHRYFLCHLKHI